MPGRADLVLPEPTDGGATEMMLRQALLDKSMDASDAQRDWHHLWRFFLKIYYGKDYEKAIDDMKLQPIAGAKKSAIDRFESGLYTYMPNDLLTAMIKIAREIFPNPLKSNRVARKYISYCLDNKKSKIRKSTDLDNTAREDAINAAQLAANQSPDLFPPPPVDTGFTIVMHPADVHDFGGAQTYHGANTLNCTAMASSDSEQSTSRNNGSVLDTLFMQ
jgi:hypothetical protein